MHASRDFIDLGAAGIKNKINEKNTILYACKIALAHFNQGEEVNSFVTNFQSSMSEGTAPHNISQTGTLSSQAKYYCSLLRGGGMETSKMHS